MTSIKKLFAWLDHNLVFLCAAFLFIFIPLYPKLPLFDVIPGYIVRVRLEDFFVLTSLVIWFIQILRRKAKFKSLLLWPIFIYLGVGFLSMVSAVFVTNTVPKETIHIAKMAFHWLRRIEYFSLYFIFYSALTSLKRLKIFTVIFGLVAIATMIYGLGQKLYQWPVYSTMNREFSKGWRLVLTEHARVPSTFAGHYDFAAFLVLFLILSVSIFLFIKKETVKVICLLGFAAALTSLILTASRASFIAYLIGVAAAVLLLSLRRSWVWGIKNWFIITAISLLFMVSFGELQGRFAHFLNFRNLRDYAKYDLLKLPRPPDYVQITQDLALVYTESDQPPVPATPPPFKNLPPDVYSDIPRWSTDASRSVEARRTYTSTAYAVGLSSAIRFDALWPRAIKGFLRNPLLGSGYSTLTKASIEEFTEAESTDNDWLRSLGETGLLGFLTFYGAIAYAFWFAWKKHRLIANNFIYAVLVGVAAGTIGLLINALYIDVFEASKVAFTFWALMGMFVATLEKIHVKKA